jgi:Mrp family chromosome partitioning ATPase
VTDRNGRLCGLFDGLANRVRSMELRTIGFTGAVFGEGASTLALGTSLSLAALEAGPVLLVDANWLGPTLTDEAGGRSRVGLADVLRGDASLADALLQTGRGGLAFLPAGVLNGESPVSAIPSFLDEALTHFSAIVTDLPPAIAGEPVVVPWAASLQQLFVVVRNGVTPLALVRRAVAQVALEKPQVVLNRIPAWTPGWAPSTPVALT